MNSDKEGYKSMQYQMTLENQQTPVTALGSDFSGKTPDGSTLAFNSFYLALDGKPFFVISGEFHYSRMDAARWEDELIKMRMGGINTVSTYVFWNHVEEKEGEFDFSGSLDLRRFVELCRKHGLWVILRIGPFCHGEVRNGGLPDWLYGKPFPVRSTHPDFLACVRRLYSHIHQEVQHCFWQDGGPIIAVQLDNEYMHSSAVWERTTGISNEWIPAGSEGEAYLLALRELALECGFHPVCFTATSWGGAAYSPRLLPLWGGYAYRPWIFYSHSGEHPATEEYLYEDYHRPGIQAKDDFDPAYPPESRPYACCEMGAGMMCCYNYRFIYPYKSVDALANIKLGSGCNLIGYYMFHGGNNPVSKLGFDLNESQVPKRSYDYQAAVGEFGQLRESYLRLKSIHYFLRSFGDRLAPMETQLPDSAEALVPENLETLRFCVRSDGESGFLFVNNFQDHRVMPPREHESITIQSKNARYSFDLSIATDENAILPFHFMMDGILLLQANAQPVLRTVLQEKAVYVFMIPDGMDGALSFEPSAEVRKTDSPIRSVEKVLSVRKGDQEITVLLLSREQANRLYLLRNGRLAFSDAALLEDEQGALRLETEQAENRVEFWPTRFVTATASVPELAVECEQTAPGRYVIRIPEAIPKNLKDVELQIRYEGDIGSLFLASQLISDNFCNGDVWEIGLREYADALRTQPLVLVISPIRKGSVVHAESAMAGRSEESSSQIAELRSIRLQSVCSIEIPSEEA